MIVVISAIVAVLAVIIWNYTVENSYYSQVVIPRSSNFTYHKSIPLDPSEVISKLDNERGRPVLLYVYTTWCGVCKKQLPVLNELAREFQNANVTFIAVAIDKNLNEGQIASYLLAYGDIYFKPYYLIYSDGIGDLLRQKGIKYKNTIPFTAIIDKEGEVLQSFGGSKNSGYIRKKLIRAIYQKDGNQAI